MLAALLLGACRPQLAAGYGTTSHVTGPLANLVTQPTAAARQDPATVAPVAEQKSYSFWIGGGTRTASIDFGAHLHDVNSQSFALPSLTDTTSPRYLLASVSLDLRVQVPITKYAAIGGHLGPTGGALLDRTDGTHQWSDGVRFGAMASANLGPATVFADLYESELVFMGGPANGVSKLTGLLVGVALR